MENNFKNRKAFFSQYYGQEVFHWLPNHCVEGYELNVLDSDRIPYAACAVLLLTPLSKITKLSFEDAQRLLILNGEDLSGLAINDIADWCNQFLYELSKDLEDPEYNGKLAVFDAVRAMGFATPWMGLSVDKQIEYGWVRLRE